MKTCEFELPEEVTNVCLFPPQTCGINDIIENWYDIGVLPPQKVMIRTMTSQQWKQIAENPLTEREFCVLKMLAHGNSNLSIAQELQIKVVTVKAHVQHIFRKLNVTDRTQAAVVALRSGLVD